MNSDIAKKSYNLLLNMLPQSVRAPLHHSIEGVRSSPEQSWNRKIEKLLRQKADDLRKSFQGKVSEPEPVSWRDKLKQQLKNDQTQPKFASPRLSKPFELTPPTKISVRDGADETTLLRKLKRLNNNPFSGDLEEQATTFVKTLLQPDKLNRKKRTIILGSDELDLPPRYQVEVVSAENDDYDDLPISEEEEDCSPVVGQSYFRSRPRIYTPNRMDTLIGKNVIQKAVRDELNAFQKKQDQEQKIKELKTNLQAKRNPVPHNPIFMLLTAPMQFLKHFSDINKGANPVITTLPKMVYTAKKYFKDFGKNFHKHCLNLASDIVGDFDQVQPNVIPLLSGRQNFQEQDFRKVLDDHVRKKRYVVKVVDDDDMQREIEHYLAEKMDDKFSYLKPLQDYYDKVADLFTKLQQPVVHQTEEDKKKVVVKEVKPKIIIDNKGWPFMEYDGFKRPLLLNRRKQTKSASNNKEKSSEENQDRITSIIARVKENSEMVGNAPQNMMPKQIIKERVHSLLEEIDQLVDLNPEDYDHIFENLMKVQQIKNSIEQDWKRLLINHKIDDVNSKVAILSKFRDLQQIKDESVKNIAEKLEETDNEFVRKQLVHSLIRLQKLQCLINNVVEDFDHTLQMKTAFNPKKEIKFVDYLSELKFVYQTTKTRNDLLKKLCQDRDNEGQKHIEVLNKLKKLLMMSHADSSDKMNTVAKLIWELKNLEKLQNQTVKDLNEKLSKNQKIKKELKILFDLQKRFEECEGELNTTLGTGVAKSGGSKNVAKKDVKDIMAEIRRKHEEMLQKAKDKGGGWQQY